MQSFCKKLYTLTISIVFIFNIADAQYCIPPLASWSTYANVARVSFADYSSNVTPGPQYYKIVVTNKSIFRGQTFFLKSLLKRYSTETDPYISATTYIDWNSDQDFDDVGELIGSHFNVYFGSEVSDLITVPDHVTSGMESRIRIIVYNQPIVTDLPPCGIHSETIDLSITFVEPPLIPGKTIPLVASKIRARSLQLAWVDYAYGETGYLVERSTDSISFTTIADLPANTILYNDSLIVPGTKYYYRINTKLNHPDSAANASFKSQAADFIWEKEKFLSIYPDTELNTGIGALWNDVDKNGSPDIFITGAATSILDGLSYGLWLNGGSTFNQYTEGFIKSSDGTWIDFDNDGDNDLYLSSNFSYPTINGESYMYENNGDGTFTRTSPFVPDGVIFSTAWSDYNNDGYIDVFVNYQGTAEEKLYRNNGDKTFSFVRSFAFFHPAHFADYDDDGDDDLITFGPTKSVYVRQDSTFTLLNTNPFLPYNFQYRGCSWGDFDNNGKIDVFIANDQSIVSSLFMNMGNGVFTYSTLDRDAFGSAIADYDNDGFEDLFISRIDKLSILYRNDQTGSLFPVSREVFINEEDSIAPFGAIAGYSAAWADHNTDGFPDLFQSVAGYNQKNRLYTNQGNTNNWIHLNLSGTASNKNAIGARIRIKSNGKWQYRWIQSNSGTAAQNDYTVEFGLGSSTSIDSLEIRWPLGDIQVITNPAINQIHDISEPTIVNVVWIGTSDNSWHNPLNWNTNKIPDAFANVTINPGTTYTCTITSPAICRTLLVMSGANVISNANLEVRK